MSFARKVRSMQEIRTSEKRLSNVQHQNKMRNMRKISQNSKQTLSHSLNENEKKKIDTNQRYFFFD